MRHSEEEVSIKLTNYGNVDSCVYTFRIVSSELSSAFWIFKRRNFVSVRRGFDLYPSSPDFKFRYHYRLYRAIPIVIYSRRDILDILLSFQIIYLFDILAICCELGGSLDRRMGPISFRRTTGYKLPAPFQHRFVIDRRWIQQRWIEIINSGFAYNADIRYRFGVPPPL